MTNQNKRYGYIRIFGEYDAYAEEQETRIKKTNKTKLVREHTFFNYEASALKETVDKMVKGDKLIVYRLSDLGLTALQTIKFIEDLDSRGLFLRVMNMNGEAIDSSFDKHNLIFETILALAKTDKMHEKSKAIYMKSHRTAKKYKKKDTPENIKRLIEERAKGKTLEELTEEFNYKSVATTFAYLKDNQERLDQHISKNVAFLLKQDKTYEEISKLLRIDGENKVFKYVKIARKSGYLKDYFVKNEKVMDENILEEVIDLVKTGHTHIEIVEKLNFQHSYTATKYIKEGKKRGLLNKDLRSYRSFRKNRLEK